MAGATPSTVAFVRKRSHPTSRAQTSQNVLQGPPPTPFKVAPSTVQQSWCSVVRREGLTQYEAEEIKFALKGAGH